MVRERFGKIAGACALGALGVTACGNAVGTGSTVGPSSAAPPAGAAGAAGAGGAAGTCELLCGDDSGGSSGAFGKGADGSVGSPVCTGVA
jgi:hypothetical protein